MQKKLLIRADGNANIGAGHIMRCMSIGNAARKLGTDVCFVTADESFLTVLKNNNFKVQVLNSDYERMEDELDDFLPILHEEKPDRLILDSYYVTKKYMETLMQYSKLIYIDDVFSFPYPTDILINYNIYASEKQYADLYVNCELPKMIIGCGYVPLREEFQAGKVIGIRNDVKSVMFSAGGADPGRIALRFVKSVISNRGFCGITFHIVIGSFEPDKEEIENISIVHKNIVTHSNVSRMSDLMLQCDMAVSAAGSTLYELCACGVPTVTYVLADNQIPGATTFANLGIMINAGDDRCDGNLIDNIIKEITNVCLNAEKRRYMQARGLAFIDGKGAKKIVQEII